MYSWMLAAYFVVVCEPSHGLRQQARQSFLHRRARLEVRQAWDRLSCVLAEYLEFQQRLERLARERAASTPGSP